MNFAQQSHQFDPLVRTISFLISICLYFADFAYTQCVLRNDMRLLLENCWTRNSRFIIADNVLLTLCLLLTFCSFVGSFLRLHFNKFISSVIVDKICSFLFTVYLILLFIITVLTLRMSCELTTDRIDDPCVAWSSVRSVGYTIFCGL